MIAQRDGRVFIDTGVLCGGPKDACDALVVQFKALNARVEQDLARPR